MKMKHTLTLLLSLLFAPLATIHAAEPVTIDLSKRTWQGIPKASWHAGASRTPGAKAS
jgi:hypothetical protein